MKQLSELNPPNVGTFVYDMILFRDATNISYRNGMYDGTVIEPTTTITLKNGKTVRGTLLSLDNFGIAFWSNHRHRFIGYARINMEAMYSIETVLKDR
jgi:hypothetical protein